MARARRRAGSVRSRRRAPWRPPDAVRTGTPVPIRVDRLPARDGRGRGAGDGPGPDVDGARPAHGRAPVDGGRGRDGGDGRGPRRDPSRTGWPRRSPRAMAGRARRPRSAAPDDGGVVATPRAQDAGPVRRRAAGRRRALRGRDPGAGRLGRGGRGAPRRPAVVRRARWPPRRRGQAAADPRSVRAAKEAAQQRFRDARSRATSRDDVEGAARSWLAEINEINQEAREATRPRRARAGPRRRASRRRSSAWPSRRTRRGSPRSAPTRRASRRARRSPTATRPRLEAAAVARTATPVAAEPAATADVAATGSAAATTSPTTSSPSPGRGRARRPLILRILRGDRGRDAARGRPRWPATTRASRAAGSS